MNLSDMFPLMAFINLESRKDRLLESRKEFEKLKINPLRVEASCPTITNNKQLNGIAGCTMSHYRCLQMALEAKSNILIFEDDVKFVNNYNEIINNACQEIVDTDWQMLYLGANILKPFNQVSPHLAKLTWAQSTHAYGVKYEFVETLMNLIPKNEIVPLDLVYTNLAVPMYNCYIVAPKMVAVQRDSYSDIECNVANYESYLEARYHHNFVPMEKK